MTMVARQEQSPEIGSFAFHGDTVTVVTNEQGSWAVLGQLCQNLALDPNGQRQTIERKAWSEGKTCVMHVMLPGQSRAYPQFLVHERILPMWLANVTTSRIADEVKRKKVERAQVELADALYRYVTGEVQRVTPAPAPREITAAAGPVSYRDQAEILAILRPALPEPYATATAKVILARAMGERPELDSSETPLYAATFLAEKGHKAKTVAKFQSGFGARVSNAFFKRHGRRPEKIAGPAGSRIDKVAVYTEDDRPLLEEVYAGMADLIAAFEHGDQIALSA
ncbi:phage antirepressor N-terminal domain-containing protein [Streptomyces sp. NPDC090077]|uniref:phage antirepressor N-terminal domain-containing protein n=1 Tax=Streptomyces sp. NPDC090077 TaxID=3365938 RepID=UPI00381A10E0